MTITSDSELVKILDVCSKARLVDEANQKIVFLPAMKFHTKNKEARQDLLFVPFHHSGYETRLLFAEQLIGNGARNWTQHCLIGRSWWAPSYRVDTSLSWRDQILQHIQAVA